MLKTSYKNFQSNNNNLETTLAGLDLKNVSNDEIEKISNILKETLESSIILLKNYLNYSGTFPSSSLMIIKIAYYNEIITDGQAWINLYNLYNDELYSYKKDINNFIRTIFSERYVKIFTELNRYLEKELN